MPMGMRHTSLDMDLKGKCYENFRQKWLCIALCDICGMFPVVSRKFSRFEKHTYHKMCSKYHQQGVFFCLLKQMERLK